MTEGDEVNDTDAHMRPLKNADTGVASQPPKWPDGTVRLPDAVEAWLDGHFAGEMGDDADELGAGRNAAAVALWSLVYQQGDDESDQAALVALLNALGGVYNGTSTHPYHWWRLPIEGGLDA